MKPLRSILTAGLALALSTGSAHALTLLSAADTSSTITFSTGKTPVITKRVLTVTGGKAGSLMISKTHDALFQFAANNFLAGKTVTSARLTIYFPAVTKAGTINVSVVTDGWSETFTGPPPAEPSFDSTPLLSIPITPALSKLFVQIDITDLVKAWVDGTTPDHGLVITSDGTASCLIGAKEGPGSGYPCTLDAEINNTSAVPLTASTGSFTDTLTGTTANFTGNVGIGSAQTPTDALDIFGSSGTRAVVLDSGDGFAGVVDQNSQHAYFTGIDTSSSSWSIIDNSSNVERFSLLSNGKIGIGTTTPDSLLTIAQSANLSVGVVSTYGLQVKSVVGGTVKSSVAIGGDVSGAHIQSFQNLPLFLNDGSNNTLINPNGGNVGIGTTTPTQAKLVVGGTSGSATFPAYTDYTKGTTLNFAAGTSFALSIFANGPVMAEEFDATSDARIKNIQGRSDNATDLQTLRSIEVTDYHFKDVIGKGNRPQKKVIAQQVEKVYPQAVAQHTDVVPDIYEKATIHDGWVSLATDLMVGDRVRLIGEKEEGIYEVLEVDEASFRTAFQPATDKIFVFGREVKDFRTVDYEAIAMLNVSATQELAKKLEAKDAEIAALKAANLALAEKMAAFDHQLAALKADHDDLPARTVRASFDLK